MHNLTSSVNMNQSISQSFPKAYNNIEDATAASGFTMASDVLTCSLLRTLAASKPGGRFLELGTGTGLSTAWILDGMDNASTLISVDNNAAFQQIASQFLGADNRLTLVCSDGGLWVENNLYATFDYIFADTWHGKYLMLDEVLAMLKPGGIYIIDDMLPQANWPEGHAGKATALISNLDSRSDLFITKQRWATGIIIGIKKMVV